MGCCVSKSKTSGANGVTSAEGFNISLSELKDPASSHDSKLLSTNKERLSPTENFESPTEKFQLSLPGYTSPCDDYISPYDVTRGSSDSLDELCTRNKGKDTKLANGAVDDIDIDINIYPLDEENISDENDIDIYPLNPDRKASLASVESLSDVIDGEPAIVQQKWKLVKSPSVAELCSQVFLGNTKVIIPNAAKIIKIYVSSTFTDTHVERNALVNRVYPNLKAFCAEHGYEFQAVDMRWNVRDASADDHVTSELCLKELRTCQKLSIGPNFVTFLGQKYGHSPLPAKILTREFEKLSRAVDDPDDKALLLQWYKKDNNAVPSKYVLQPISSQFPNFVNPPDKESRMKALIGWWDVFLAIQSALRVAAKKTLKPAEAHKYFLSVTEQEAEQGIFHSHDSNTEAFWFRRNITDLKEHLKNQRSALYIDIKEVSRRKLKGRKMVKAVDKSAQTLLKNLEEKRIPKSLSSGRIVTYDIKFGESGIDPNMNTTHAQYVDRFCQDFHKLMKSNIEDAIKKHEPVEVKDETFLEAAQHISLCQVKCKHFHGREETLEKIKSYISGSDTKEKPLVIHGPSGSGKSSLVAMAAMLTRSWTANESVVILRFLGTSRDSSSIRLVLRSICLQLCKAFKIDSRSVPKNFMDLVREFHNRLKMAKASKPLVIFLDSLDQLSYSDGAHQLTWLLRKLPPYVRMVVSTLNEGFSSCLPVLQAAIQEQVNFIDVSRLPEPVAADILRAWMTSQHRRLTDEQEQTVLQAFNKCSQPLFLKLAFERALHWKSYSEETVLRTSIRSVINTLFDTLERRHGKILIHHAMGYFTASKHGLSDAELEDVLSCDDVVLDEVFQHWTPSIRRLPPSLWVRIRTDIDLFLVDHVTDGVHVSTWSHRQFREVAEERYLHSDEGEFRRVHLALADFFHGRWASGAEKGDGKGTLKDRHVAAQPLMFSESIFNLRKLHELPYHLINAGDVDKVKQNVLCNFEFLLTKLKGLSVNHVLDDFGDALTAYPGNEDLKLICETLQLSRDALSTAAGQLAAQLIGRLASPRSPSPFIARLLRQAHHPSLPTFIPNIPCLTRPGGKLVHSLPGLHGAINLSESLSSYGTKAVTGSRDRTITLWDIESGNVLKSLETTKDIGNVALCLDDGFAVASCRGTIQVWNLATGGLEYQLGSTSFPAPIAVAASGEMLVALVKDTIKLVKLADGTTVREFKDADYVHNKVACFQNFVALANSSGRYVRIYDINCQQVVRTIQAYNEESRDVVSCLIVSPFDEGQVLVSSLKSFDLRVFSLHTGRCLHMLGPDIVYPTITQDGRYMLCTNCYNDVSIWNLETAMKERHVIKHPPTTEIAKICCLDLKIVVTISDDKLVRVWDLEREEVANVSFEDNKGENSIQKLAMIKGKLQKQVVTKSRAAGPICVWNLGSCSIMRTLNGANADDIFVVDETRAVVRKRAKLALIDLEEGKLIKKMRSDFPVKTDKVSRHASSLYKRRDLAIRLAESPRVERLHQTRSKEFSDCALVGTSHVLILSKDRLYMKLASLETGELVGKLKAGQKSIIQTVMVSGDGSVAVCSCEKQPLLVWDLKQRTRRFTLEMNGNCPQLTTADISYDGRYLVDVLMLDRTHKTVVTWDLKIGEVKHVIGQGRNVWSVAVASQSMCMLVAGSSGNGETVRVYNLSTGKLETQLDGHTEPVKGICLSRDGRRALTYIPLGHRDRTIRLWDIIDGTMIAAFTPDLAVSSCVMSDDGEQVAMVINKSRPIVSLALTHEVGSREMSVDVSNPYYQNPSHHGAVFDLSAALSGEESDSDVDL